MNDEQLLKKYKNYIKKRNIVIIASLLFLFFLSMCFIYSISVKKEKNNNQSTNEPKVEQKQDIIDDKPPVLELTTDKITIEVDTTITYKEFIKEANDDIDGDLVDKVQYSSIDTSKTGEYEVLYFVFDSSNNMAKKILNVLIIEHPEESTKKEDTETNDNNSTSNKQNSTSNNTENESNNKKPSIPQTKYFLFTDGYTMSNVVEACATELKKYNGSGMCSPITDDKGIYLGMKLELK